MFEKEADKAETKMIVESNGVYSKFKNYKEGFKDGAEFGYNKANEWHYVKDGDLPKEDCLVYYKDAMGNFSFSFIHPSYYIAGVESFFKANPQIIAWKEIVLPKEIKEND